MDPTRESRSFLMPFKPSTLEDDCQQACFSPEFTDQQALRLAMAPEPFPYTNQEFSGVKHAELILEGSALKSDVSESEQQVEDVEAISESS